MYFLSFLKKKYTYALLRGKWTFLTFLFLAERSPSSASSEANQGKTSYFTGVIYRQIPAQTKYIPGTAGVATGGYLTVNLFFNSNVLF